MREITKHVRREIIQSNFRGFNNFFFLAAADGLTGNRAIERNPNLCVLAGSTDSDKRPYRRR